jgi:hypothetical protein
MKTTAFAEMLRLIERERERCSAGIKHRTGVLPKGNFIFVFY